MSTPPPIPVNVRMFPVLVHEETARLLMHLATSTAVQADPARFSPDEQLQEVIHYLLGAIAAGVRRPGSWERGVVEQLFGDFE